MEKEITYKDLMDDRIALKDKTIEYIHKNLLEQKGGHHILNVDETFYEAGIEDGAMKVIELKIMNVSIFYKRADWSDENDWYLISRLEQLDLFYIASLYS